MTVMICAPGQPWVEIIDDLSRGQVMTGHLHGNLCHDELMRRNMLASWKHCFRLLEFPVCGFSRTTVSIQSHDNNRLLPWKDPLKIFTPKYYECLVID